MMQITCLEKLRDKNCIIYWYRIMDKMSGERRDVTPNQLKNAIALQQCVCDNLTLTSDWRLMNSNGKIGLNFV